MNARCQTATAAQGERATIGCIEPNNGDVPFFRHVDGAAIPLRVVDGPSCPTWQEEVAREIFTPFAGDAAPLLRATLIHEANRAVFILAAHHTISDVCPWLLLCATCSASSPVGRSNRIR